MKNLFKRLFGWLRKKEKPKDKEWIKKYLKEHYKEFQKSKPLTPTTKASEVNQSTESDTFEIWASTTKNGDYKE